MCFIQVFGLGWRGLGKTFKSFSIIESWQNMYTLLKINIEPKNHPLEKENRFANLHFVWFSCWFSRVQIKKVRCLLIVNFLFLNMFVYFNWGLGFMRETCGLVLPDLHCEGRFLPPTISPHRPPPCRGTTHSKNGGATVRWFYHWNLRGRSPNATFPPRNSRPYLPGTITVVTLFP